MIIKQVTNDKDVMSFYTKLTSATCAYSFLSKKDAREMNKVLIKANERAMQLKEPFNMYLANELEKLGITKEELSKELREEIIKDFIEIQQASNQILGFKY